MIRQSERPGAAFRAMALILALWTGARVLFWESGWADAPEVGTRPAEETILKPARTGTRLPVAFESGATAGWLAPPPARGRRAIPRETRRNDRRRPRPESRRPARPSRYATTAMREPPPPAVDIFSDPRKRAAKPARRWHGYAYVHWRERGAGSNAALLPSYGGGQVYTRLSYDLAPRVAGGLGVYGRYARALDGPAEGEYALGLTLDPAEALPVGLQAEWRVRADGGDAAALFLAGGGTTDLPGGDAELALFGQAGALLGGPEGTLGFYDGQADLRVQIAAPAGAELLAGAKLSGGGQGGDGRFDIGPAVTLRMPVDDAYLVVEAGWRERIAGNVRPGSGAALTASVGF